MKGKVPTPTVAAQEVVKANFLRMTAAEDHPANGCINGTFSSRSSPRSAISTDLANHVRPSFPWVSASAAAPNESAVERCGDPDSTLIRHDEQRGLA